MFSLLLRLPGECAILLVKCYQWTLSPLVGNQCRFVPSCSNYMILAIRKHGLIIGGCKGTWRIMRCNPFCKGGEDFP